MRVGQPSDTAVAHREDARPDGGRRGETRSRGRKNRDLGNANVAVNAPIKRGSRPGRARRSRRQIDARAGRRRPRPAPTIHDSNLPGQSTRTREEIPEPPPRAALAHGGRAAGTTRPAAALPRESFLAGEPRGARGRRTRDGAPCPRARPAATKDGLGRVTLRAHEVRLRRPSTESGIDQLATLVFAVVEGSCTIGGAVAVAPREGKKRVQTHGGARAPRTRQHGVGVPDDSCARFAVGEGTGWLATPAGESAGRVRPRWPKTHDDSGGRRGRAVETAGRCPHGAREDLTRHTAEAPEPRAFEVGFSTRGPDLRSDGGGREAASSQGYPEQGGSRQSNRAVERVAPSAADRTRFQERPPPPARNVAPRSLLGSRVARLVGERHPPTASPAANGFSVTAMGSGQSVGRL